jgi:hypothetical protein
LRSGRTTHLGLSAQNVGMLMFLVGIDSQQFAVAILGIV